MIRYKLLIICSFFLSIFCFSRVYALVNDYSLIGKIIYLDAGHGGIDSGAVYGDIYEKDINLVLVNKLANELVSRGAIVYLTRDGDYDLSTTKINRKRSDLANRAKLINNSNCDLYLSIHLNFMDNSKWGGFQIFYNDKNINNKNIAIFLTDSLKNEFSYIRDYKYDNTYYMYKLIERPGVLIEMGFLSNSNDRYRLTRGEYGDDLISSIVDSISSYFNNS